MLNLSLTGTYTESEAEMDQMRNFGIPAGMPAASYDYDLSTVDNYSDLDIRQIDLSVGADYKVDDNFSLGLGFTYLRYEDNECGAHRHDDSGDACIYNVSMSYLF